MPLRRCMQVDDAAQYLDDVKAQVAGMPIFIAGNSLGGLVASHLVLVRPDVAAGLIMQSPALDVEWTPVLRLDIFRHAACAVMLSLTL